MASKKSSRQPTRTKVSDPAVKVEPIPLHLSRLMAGYRSESPRNAIKVLMRAACKMDHAGHGTRHFLYWLDGENPPDGPNEEGASVLINMTDKQKDAAIAVLKWWIVLGRNIEPIINLYPKIEKWYVAEKARRN